MGQHSVVVHCGVEVARDAIETDLQVHDEQQGVVGVETLPGHGVSHDGGAGKEPKGESPQGAHELHVGGESVKL